ncbi:chitin synthase regulatory factor 3-like [Lecanosticta acicola]|uniref:Chitin synthase regulatory factor 3-like n=1 Tax=Lecanosticta acicola TaxID=111012 RepID=A0AAI8Z4Y1_9PEZI|nr:chitin synthase regulatory factor 3-like [Lecanosticta acicola]
MAYDQNSAYEPPRRGYMEQRQQASNPAYSTHGYDDQYNQGNTQPYHQHQRGAGGYDYGYSQELNAPQEHMYNEGGYGIQGDGQQWQQEQARSYDPRYQQRPQRGPPPQQHARPGPQSRGPPPPARGAYQGDPRGQPRQNGHPPPQRSRDPYEQPVNYHEPARRPHNGYEEQNGYDAQSQRGYAPQRSKDPYEQQNGQYAPPRQAERPRDPYAQYGERPKQNGQYPPQDPRGGQISQKPSGPPQASGKGRTSMEEWKAQEKAKMKKAATSPETLPFDNAFPVFGKKSDRSSDKSGGASIPSQRGSVEQGYGRPPTSNGQRPATSRENSYRHDNDVQSPPRRPDLDRQYSTDAPQRQQTTYIHPQEQRQAPHGLLTPTRDEYPDQWPMTAGQTPPKAQSDRRSPPRSNVHDPSYPSQAQEPRYQQGFERPNQAPPSQSLPKQRGPPPIDTNQIPRRPLYADPQPFSPAHVPPRPSTSQGQRPAPHQQPSSPLAQHSQSGIPQGSYASLPEQSAKRWPEEHAQHGSLEDIYDHYNTTPPRAIKRAPTSREEEIEAEMPDFDSAAPGQTSNLHRRIQPADKQTQEAPAAAPPPMQRMQTAPPSSMPPSQSAHDLHYAQNPYGPRPGTAGPLRGPPRRGMTDPHNNSASSTPMSARGQRQHDIPYRNQPPQNAMYPQDAPLPPPNAPYANDMPVRRSLDDARGPPGRQGPGPGPRFPPNGAQPRGMYPPQRPGFDGHPTAQTVWSDPGLERVGSAPPPQDALAERPGMNTGVPLTQQRSAPEQPGQGSNPDALPHHPTPVRPGLMQQGQPQPNKPSPVRNYDGAQGGAPHQRQASVDPFAQQVTHAELERLRNAVDKGPNNPKQHLVLVKKLVEACAVLAPEGGRADAKTTAKNRERYTHEAYKRLKKLVAGGYAEAQFYMADCYGQGMLGLEADTKEAFKLYQAAAKAGHAQAAYRTAVCCEMGPEEGGGTSKDFAKAVQWYRRAAALGDPAAMYKVGAVMLKGLLGQPKNITEAVTWLKRGAERADLDNPHALHELATIYESANKNPEIRNKVTPDDAYAKNLFMQAAKLGFKASQFRLGQAYEYGDLGLPISNRDSIAWYTKAASQGEHQAELALSGWYLTGAEGILEHSDTEAYLWARKAASSEGGPQVAKAMFAMGYFAENGIGCPASMDEARRWYGRAASYKFPKAIERLEELKKGGKSSRPAPANGKLTRKDQKHNEENCVVM